MENRISVKNIQISVVIPLYNKCETIGRALESVFSQIVQPFEIIVVNDGSTDGSETLVKQINHPLIRIFNQTNSGVSAARNKGIEMAKGEWIAFLDADDEWRSEFLKTMQMLAFTYPQCHVVGSAYEINSHNGIRKPIILNKIPFIGEHGLLTNYFEVATCSQPPISSISIMVTVESIRSIGGFPVGIKAGEDLLTWARLAVKYKIGYTVLPLSIVNLDLAHQVTHKPTRFYDENDPVGHCLVLLNQTYNYKSLRKYISHWYKMMSSFNIRLNNRGLAIKYALKALSYNTLNYKVYLFILMALLPVYIQEKIKQIYIL